MLTGRSNLTTIFGNSSQLYIVTSLAVILSFLTPDYIGFYILSILLILFSLLFKEKFILFSITVLLLVFIGEINPDLRLVIQLLGILFLISFVLRNYGFDIKEYPRVPLPVLSFIFSLYTALTISILNSDFSFAAIPLVLRLSTFFVFIYLFYVMIKSVGDVRLYIYAIIGLLFNALIMTDSRTALLACAVSGFMILFGLNKKLLASIANSLVSVILIMMLIEPVRNFLTLALREERGLAQRDHLW